MYPSWLHVIGTNFLLLHIANSLVLLTANVEDVKRIAQKFVSESLAEKLIDLVIKATNKEINISEENSENDGNVNDVSANQWTTDVHRKIKTTQNSYRKDKDKKTRYKLKIRNSKEQKPIPKTHFEHRQNPYTFTIKHRTPAIVSKGIDRIVNTDNIDKNFMRSRFIQNADTVNEVILRTNTLTTEKERTEFDQYDNINYSRSADVIATSGGVALTKSPESEKEENK